MPNADGPSFLPDLTLPHDGGTNGENNNVTTTLTVVPVPPQTPASVAAPIVIFAGSIAALVALWCVASHISRRRMEKRERKRRIGAAARRGIPLGVFRRRHHGEGEGGEAVQGAVSKPDVVVTGIPNKADGVRLEAWEVGVGSRGGVDDVA